MLQQPPKTNGILDGWLERLVYEINPINTFYPGSNVTDHGVATASKNSIKDYVDAIGTSLKATLILKHNSSGNTTTYTLTTSETISSNVTLKMEPGAIIDGAGTLTINGPFEAGLTQCFGSSITVVGLKEVYPEWWGIDGIADEVQINAAISAIASVTTGASSQNVTGTDPAGEVYLSGKRYIVAATINIPTYVALRGQGKHITILDSYITDGSAVVEVIGDATTHCFYNTLSDFSIDGRNQNCIGILIDRAHRWKIDNVFVGETNYEGIKFYEAYLGDLYAVMVRECGNASHAAVEFTGPSANYGSHALHFYGGEIINQNGIGVNFTYALNSGLIGTTVENCGGIGVVIGSSATSTTIDQCYFEANYIHVKATGTKKRILNNFFSTISSETLTGITGSINAASATLTVNDATDIAIGDFLSIVGVTGTKLVTNVAGTTITVHSVSDATVAGAAVTQTNPAIVLDDVTSPTITGNYFPSANTDIMPYDSGSYMVRGVVSGNHAFGAKTQIDIDAQLKTTNNFIIGFDGTYQVQTGKQKFDSDLRLLGFINAETMSETIADGEYADSTLTLSAGQAYLVATWEPTDVNTTVVGINALVARQGTGTIINTLAAGTFITLSCDNTTGYALRFSNASGSTKYLEASLLRLK